ncbi:MAG TPA: hypothetical protein VE715_17240 [Blastocatellia bacterium]|nr:hypothetical protein [Blastocatellia bacterium]
MQPENVIEVWLSAKRDILADHPELPDARAGELAAARVFNWFHEDWATFSDAVRDEVVNSAGKPEGIDPQRLQLYEKLVDWTPLHKLQQMSGSRTLLRDLEHAIVTERSTPPAEVIRVRNHWRTERMVDAPETFQGLKEEWGNIRAEFRGRATGEGCLYTNSQGMHAIKTAFELIQQEPYRGRIDALTTNLSGAVEAIDYFRELAHVLGGKAGASVGNLAGLFEEAILDAVTNKREGIAIVDTTVPGDKDDPPLTSVKKSLRHEATHVWQCTINHKRPGLLSDIVIKADPDYPVLKRAFSEYYANIKPDEIVSEAVAFVVSGDWKRAGFADREQGLKFIDRFFSNVVIRYGKKSLDSLRLTHPTIKEVIENVRNIPTRELRSRGETAKDLGGGPESVEEGSRNDGEAQRGLATIRSAQSRLAGGWSGEDVGGLRGDGPEPSAVRSSGRRINLSQPDTEIGPYPAANISQAAQDMGERAVLPGADLPQNTTTDDDRRGAVNADLIKCLQTIAVIESINPDGMRYTWRGLAVESAMIAREALAYHEIQTGNFEVLSAGRLPGAGSFSKSVENHMVEALQEIANIEFLDPGEYSWKDRAVIAGTIAREALGPARRELTVEESSALQNGDNHDQSWSHSQTSDLAQLVHPVGDEDHSFSF